MIQPWFSDAKLGIFIHWGIYAVNPTGESWPFFKGEISYEDYMAQQDGFGAENYDPRAWARLFKKAGARYAVLTTKHHDGVALWDTDASDLNTVKATPAGRDLIKPYVEALRAEDLKVGLYFSHIDWSHPDYATLPNGRDESAFDTGTKTNRFNFRGKKDLEAWERFLKFHRAQLKELCDRFSPDLLWFDGDWERKSEEWRMEELHRQLHDWCPDVILNSRMCEERFGDYATPEQALPVIAPEGPWEFCMTLNDHWGYMDTDTNYKTVPELVFYLVECVSKGGNLLLDIGPKADGTIPEEQVALLEGLGDWIHRHDRAIFGTRAGMPAGHFHGPSTVSEDGRTLYLFFYDRPQNTVGVKGLASRAKRIRVLGSDTECVFKEKGGAVWLNIPGVTWIDVPEEALDPVCTVLEVELERELDLHRAVPGAIEAN